MLHHLRMVLTYCDPAVDTEKLRDGKGIGAEHGFPKGELAHSKVGRV